LRDRWIHKNVNLQLLADNVKDFLSQQYFETRIETSRNGHTVCAIPKKGGISGFVVRILGEPNDFTVEFAPNERLRYVTRLGFITTLLGGGGILLRGLKSQEMLEKLEEEFWVFIDTRIEGLIDSADG